MPGANGARSSGRRNGRSMNRRKFVAAVAGGLVTAWHQANAQVRKGPRRIGQLGFGAPDTPAIIQREEAPLRQLGWIDGQTVVIERRFGNDADQLRRLAMELIGLNVEVIIADGTAAALAAKGATTTIPIVFSAYDPVGAGLVSSLARPSGNLTGFSFSGPEVDIKRLELLRELLPRLARVGILVPSTARFVRESAERACRSLRIQPIVVDVAASGQPGAIDEVVREGGQALVLFQPLRDGRDEFMSAVLRHAIPAMVAVSDVGELGGLMSFSPVPSETFERVAAYVDKILRGASPGVLPVEQPTRFEMAINLRTAKAIGTTVPRSLLSVAHRVIE